MKYKNLVVNDARGSLGGLTFSGGRTGNIIRVKTIPTASQSNGKTKERSRFGGFSIYWARYLTETQRNAWDLFASLVPWTDSLGQTIYLQGINWFCAINSTEVSTGSYQMNTSDWISRFATIDLQSADNVAATTTNAYGSVGSSPVFTVSTGERFLVTGTQPAHAGSVTMFLASGFSSSSNGVQISNASTPPTGKFSVVLTATADVGDARLRISNSLAGERIEFEDIRIRRLFGSSNLSFHALPPDIFGIGPSPTNITGSYSVAANTYSFDIDPYGANMEDTHVAIFPGAAVPVHRSYHEKTYSFASSGPSYELTISLPARVPIQLGQKSFVKMVFQNRDGRYSRPLIVECVAGA